MKAPMSHSEAFPADAALPALAQAFDPAAMVAHLAHGLRARVDACTIGTFRHRPGRRTIVKYTVDVPGVAAAWPVTGTIYPDAERAARHASELAEQAASVTAWSAPFAPVGVVPELSMTLQVYPFDAKLPALRELAAGLPGEVACELAEASLGTRDAGWTTELARYRPGLAATLRCSARDGDRVARFYAKVAAGAADDTGDTWLQGRDELAGFRIARPARAFEALGAVVTPELAGTPLDELVARGEGEAAAANVARRLVGLHRGDVRPEARFTAAQHVAALERAAGFVAWARPDLAARAQRIVAAVERAMDDGALAPAHRDLKPDHVLVDDAGRPGLIDLDSCGMADPMLDVSTLLARLHALPMERPVARRHVDGAMQTIARTYLPLVPREWRARLQPLYAGALVEVAASIFRRQVPGWEPAVASLVGEAERADGVRFGAGRGAPAVRRSPATASR
jgi:phosphotransferase family enzyme